MDKSAGGQPVRAGVSAPAAPTAAQRLRELIAKHRSSVMVAASGMGPVLGVLDAYIVATDAQLRHMAARIAELEKRR